MTAAEQKIFTANAVVNGILNLKLQKMEMAQIEYEFDIHIPEQLKIQGTDLGVLLGNLLDNAIEACQEFQGEKKIRLLMEYQNSGVVIHCENPCNEDTETLQTKKKDKINHGFGMGSIAQIVKKYDGFWEYQMKSGLFKVTVNLWEREMIQKYIDIENRWIWYKIENNTLFLCELLHKKGVFVTFSEMRGEIQI